MNSDNNSSSLIWEKVSSGDEKIPRLKSGDSSREDDDEDGDDDENNSGYSSSHSSSSVISSPEEIEKIEAEKRSRNAKRTRKKRVGKKRTASKSAQARSIMWYVCMVSLSNRTSQLLSRFRCKEHFESETPNAEGQSTHFTKGAVYRSSQLGEDAGEDAAEPTPGPSGITGTAGRGSEIDVSSRKKKKKKKTKKQQARRSRGATTEDAWSRRPTRQRRRRRATHCDYDSDDSVESSPERYREAKFKINGHILRKKPWLSLERRKSSENK